MHDEEEPQTIRIHESAVTALQVAITCLPHACLLLLSQQLTMVCKVVADQAQLPLLSNIAV